MRALIEPVLVQHQSVGDVAQWHINCDTDCDSYYFRHNREALACTRQQRMVWWRIGSCALPRSCMATAQAAVDRYGLLANSADCFAPGRLRRQRERRRGGGNSGSNGTPAGTYTVLITGTANGVVHNAKITVVVS